MKTATARNLILAGLLASGVNLARADGEVLLDEGFDGTTLPAGWIAANFSQNPAAEAWFKPLDLSGKFSAHSGEGGSYAASSVFVGLPDADGNPTGRIDALLLTPLIAMDQATVMSFFTRTLSNSLYGESLKLGALIGGSFHDLLTVNPTVSLGTYPESWTEVSYVLPAQGEGVTGQFYFEYLIPDAATAGNFVGLDSVYVTTAVPEPATGVLMLLGCAGLLAVRQRTARKT